MNTKMKFAQLKDEVIQQVFMKKIVNENDDILTNESFIILELTDGRKYKTYNVNFDNIRFEELLIAENGLEYSAWENGTTTLTVSFEDNQETVIHFITNQDFYLVD